MRLIDAHINVTEDGRWFDTSLDASVDTALRQMDKAGVERAGIIPLPAESNRAYVRELAIKRADRFFTGFAIASTSEKERWALADFLQDASCRFVKLHPRLTGISPVDRRLDPFLALAQKAGRPLVFCSYARGPKLPIAELLPFAFDDLARRRPQLRIVLAHAGGHRVMDALAIAQGHANVYLDFAHTFAYYQGSSVIQDALFALNHIDRKAIYGSDFPEYPIDEYHELVTELTNELEGFEAEGFFGGNAARLFGL